MKMQVIKAVRIDGKVYANPKFAAMRWVEMTLRNRWIRRDNAKTWRRFCDRRLKKRYAKMALPYFEKILS